MIRQVVKKLKDKYLSTEEQRKPIINVNTGIKIEIWRSGISETFGNDKYYLKLSKDIKRAKIATMESLAKLVKYGKIRCKEATDYHNIKSKVKYAYLVYQIYIDNTPYKVTMDIRKYPNGENRFYIHNLSLQNKSDLSLLSNETQIIG